MNTYTITAELTIGNETATRTFRVESLPEPQAIIKAATDYIKRLVAGENLIEIKILEYKLND